MWLGIPLKILSKKVRVFTHSIWKTVRSEQKSLLFRYGSIVFNSSPSGFRCFEILLSSKAQSCSFSPDATVLPDILRVMGVFLMISDCYWLR